MGPCGRPEGDPNAWKQFGPKPDPGTGASGRLGSEGLWIGDYRGGGEEEEVFVPITSDRR